MKNIKFVAIGWMLAGCFLIFGVLGLKQHRIDGTELGYLVGVRDGMLIQKGIDNGTYTNAGAALQALDQMRKESLKTISLIIR